jgi:hypothetical protein
LVDNLDRTESLFEFRDTLCIVAGGAQPCQFILQPGGAARRDVIYCARWQP